MIPKKMQKSAKKCVFVKKLFDIVKKFIYIEGIQRPIVWLRKRPKYHSARVALLYQGVWQGKARETTKNKGLTRTMGNRKYD